MAEAEGISPRITRRAMTPRVGRRRAFFVKDIFRDSQRRRAFVGLSERTNGWHPPIRSRLSASRAGAGIACRARVDARGRAVRASRFAPRCSTERERDARYAFDALVAMAGAQQSAGDVQRCIDRARSERHGPNTLGCKHAQNLEYALFFQYMMESSVERNPQGMEAQWSKTLFKIVGSLRKLPSRVRSLEHANAIHGVGPRTLDLFRRYLTAHPPDPPSDAELLADEAAAEATRAAKEAEKARKKAERDAKKRAADDARARSQAKSSAPTPRTPVDDPGGAARRRYDPRGADDDIIAIVLDESPATRPSEPSKRNRRNPTSAADDADAARPPKRARAPAAKQTRKDKPSRWEPGYRTAPFALLATLHRLHLQGETTVGKKRLMDAAELSGLSAQGIYPKGDDAQGVGVGGYRGDGARFAYSGWSCFGKQLAKAPKGWPAPMVMTWSNPVQIRLTDEGKMLGAWMHAAAETRGDCACGLMSAEDVARAEAERRRIVFGAAEPGDDEAEEEGRDRDRDRERERAPSSPARRREADAETGKALAGEKKKERRDETDVAALRRERARAATLEEIARIRASARGEAPSAAYSDAGEDARTPPRARAAAAAEKRRSADGRAPAPAPAPSDDDVVVLDDDDDEADARDLPPFVSSSGRRRSPPDERDARRFEPSVGVEMFDPRASEADAPRGGAATRRAPRLPPISAGKTFADEYEVVLVVDNREQFGGGRRAAGQSRSEHRLEEVRRIAAAHGIAAEVGHLECGDATWVARRRRGTHVAGAADDYVLDFAVERKSLEDLKLSIQDDRYRQQKFFLKKSGLRNLGYLVEGDVARFADRPDVSEQSAKAVGSAAVQTEVWDGFSVIRTEDVKETFDVLARMTLAMRERFARMRAEDGAAARPPSGDEEDDRREPLTLTEYNANLVVAKRSLSTLKNVWGSMLMSTTGLGPEYAQAITDRFPTPGALNAAYINAGSAEAAASLLASTPVSGNRTVGPVVSKRVYATLFGHELTPLA